MTAKPKTREESTASVGSTPASAPPPRLLRLPEVMEKVGLRRSAIYQRMSEGRLPKCRSLGPK
ncbi:AlpA family phage regulatory protein [Erythrobacter sp. WG]|uniref:AlpA family phage regulatory protein n=1 Tax=Erythrobacter sp. WG TaxID=2985510 RepID=UPI00226DC0E3|nr:AlpA family phage regulatory protein [Erythrobacter sp. WG]MCX9146512.1 AlpA family transcriptional regulator [Erythrobacter sp. WG]